jgi:hypothetical protein
MSACSAAFAECEGFDPYAHDPRWPPPVDSQWRMPGVETYFACWPITHHPCLSTPPDGYAWPGGYTIVFYHFDEHGSNEGTYCAACAGKARDEAAFAVLLGEDHAEPLPIRPWLGHGRNGTAALYANPCIVFDTYDEGPALVCDDCGALLESSYGDPDAPDVATDCHDDE